MIKFLFTQAYRAFMMQIKNYIGVIVAIILIAGVGGYSVISQIHYSTLSLQDYVFEFAIGCSALCFIIVAFGKRPAFRIHPATIYFFAHSTAFRWLKVLALAKKFVGLSIIACIIGLIVYDFKLSTSFARFLSCFTFYFISVSLVAWFKYNGEKSGVWLTGYLACTVSFILFVYFKNLLLLGMIVLMTAVFVVYYFIREIDMSRYYEDSLYIERINSASRHKDMAAMLQIAADHAANKKHSIKLHDFPIKKNNVLFYKAVIETIRMSKQVVAVLAVFLAIAIIINRTTLFNSSPIIGDPSISKLIGMLSLACFGVNLKEIYLKRISSMLAKSREGLFLPYKNTKVILYYSLICNIVIALTIIVVGVLLQSNPFYIALSGIIFLCGVDLELWVAKRKQWLMIASNIVIFAATYCLF